MRGDGRSWPIAAARVANFSYNQNRFAIRHSSISKDSNKLQPLRYISFFKLRTWRKTRGGKRRARLRRSAVY